MNDGGQLIKRIRKALSSSSLAPHDKIDRVEAEMIHFPQVEMPVTDHFSPGIYLREIFIPAGTFLTSAVHKTEHPFFVMAGEIWVYWTDQSGREFASIFEGPTYSVTLPGTRRILFSKTDTVWITVHATDKTDPDEIVGGITQHDNPLIQEEFVKGWQRANDRNKEALCQG